MPHHRFFGQVQLPSESTHLVLEQKPQWLNNLHLHPVWQATHIVMCLDDARWSTEGGRFNHIWVQGSLQQHALFEGKAHLCHGSFESFNEQSANDLSLLFGLGHAGQSCIEIRLCIDHLQFQAWNMLLKPILHRGSFILPQQPSVHHERPEAIPNGFVHECSCHTGIHTTADSSNHILLLHLRHHDVNLGLCKITHVPFAFAAANLQHKVLDHGGTSGSVRHLRMELDTVELSVSVLHGCVLAAACAGNWSKALGQLGHLVAMTHPHLH
mmetsp:Transcript_111165/g.203675  ORF Transcript_111165/g.203675 Transcript_111165/m.203675 type:complete len:269 (+) Transcript_111165:613-1419(+)